MARDLAGFEARVLALLMDATHAVFALAQVDEGLSQALDEYTRASLERGAVVRSNEKIATLTPTANLREVSLSTLTGLIDVTRVWFPYHTGAAYYSEPPRWVDFETQWNANAPSLFLRIAGVPDGVDLARVYYRIPHTLKDLSAATVTTFDAQDDSLLVLGAAGWACIARSTDLAEDSDLGLTATLSYATLAARLLKLFRKRLAPRRTMRSTGSAPAFAPGLALDRWG